jgi:hypothetical protein
LVTVGTFSALLRSVKAANCNQPQSQALCVIKIMFRALKIINSKNKANIRFVAADSYQIEFFENDGQEYFTIYRFNHGGEGGARYNLICLSNVSIASVSSNEFQILDGASTYKIRITDTDKKRAIHVIRYLWGWLPVSKLGGKVSKAGLGTLKSNLKRHLNDLAA